MTALSAPAEGAALSVTRLAFSDLAGWDAADHEAALSVFAASRDRVRDASGIGVLAADWAATPAFVGRGAARRYFESAFTPVLISDGGRALFTAYYEPELRGARAQGGAYQTPLYAPPPELGEAPYLTRAEIEEGGLAGRGLEIVWLDDPVEAFFLQIQGSGRIRLAEGGSMRVGFAGRNNHPYRALGRLLVERGALTLEEATADGIRDWLRAQPDGGAAAMIENPSYVFFVERTELREEDGPVGALGAPLTAGVSVAVDPEIHPLGAPIWIEAEGVPGYGRRLMVAQDVGGAIRGAQRADLFFGSGDEAGRAAGRVRAPGRIVTLLPREAALRLAAR